MEISDEPEGLAVENEAHGEHVRAVVDTGLLDSAKSVEASGNSEKNAASYDCPTAQDMQMFCAKRPKRVSLDRLINSTPPAVFVVLLAAIFIPTTTLESYNIGLFVTIGLWVWLIGFAALTRRAIRGFWNDVKKKIKGVRTEPKRTGVNGAILDYLKNWDDVAGTHRNNLDRLAKIAAFLSPAAVFVLSIQIVAMREGDARQWGWIPIALEILVILVAMVTIYHERFPFSLIPKSYIPSHVHADWIPSRLTAELLRRELFLVLARIGPYLCCPDVDAVRATVNRRCIALNAHEPRPLPPPHLVELVQMQQREKGDCPDHVTALYWRDELENVRQPVEKGCEHPVRDLPKPTDIDTYLFDRLIDQQSYYFIPRGAWHEMLDHAFENIARLALGLALILATLHIKLMLAPAHEEHVPEPIKLFHSVLEISALVMPALGAGFITLRAFFENHRLSRSYVDQARQLDTLYTAFNGLRPDWQANPGDLRLTHTFQRLVLRTETLLTAELRRWWLIVEPEEPTGG